VPAAAVIPAPVAYIKVVAVKKLVVGFWCARLPFRLNCRMSESRGHLIPSLLKGYFTLKKIECFKQAYCRE
jgi:hypothetical protein